MIYWEDARLRAYKTARTTHTISSTPAREYAEIEAIHAGLDKAIALPPPPQGLQGLHGCGVLQLAAQSPAVVVPDGAGLQVQSVMSHAYGWQVAVQAPKVAEPLPSLQDHVA